MKIHRNTNRGINESPKPLSDQGRDNWDRIFGKKKKSTAMTRKNFERIADNLAKMPAGAVRDASIEGFVDELSDKHENFDEGRFRSYITENTKK